MCFYKNGAFSKHAVSDADIECYKIMWCYDREGKTKLHPLISHRELIYNVGDTMSPFSVIDVSILDRMDIIGGGVIHSYDLEVAVKVYNNIIHRWDAYFWGTYSRRVKMVKCVIPSGTPYWHNSKGEYVSTELVIKKVIYAKKVN